jgi:ABC-type transport system involved in multi-copper enzyme maturation permease subunit
MSEQSRSRKLPGDMNQVQVVWRYEILKYLRSKRLLSSVVIVVAITALIYALPQLAGSDYHGTETAKEVKFHPLDEPLAFQGVTIYGTGSLGSSTIDMSTLQLYNNGTLFPSNNGTNWRLMNSGSIGGSSISVNTVVFNQNVTNQVITASFKWHTPVTEFDTLFINFASILVVICATFFGADSIVGEFQNRTGYLMFPNPIKRSSILYGKFGASMTVGVVVLGLFYLAVAVLSMLTLGGVDDDFGMSFAFANHLLAVMAIAYMISSILKGPLVPLVPTFFMFVMILPIVDSVGMFAGEDCGVADFLIRCDDVHDVGPVPGGHRQLRFRDHDTPILPRPSPLCDNHGGVCGGCYRHQPRAVQQEAAVRLSLHTGATGGCSGGNCWPHRETCLLADMTSIALRKSF